ncbi:MAG: NADH-quinone oxidoreductase subunit L [Caldilineaceae bacterium]|nr:NADH-quinone oxidoreductase subunit L [Caldilineaceae bacterium]
MEGLFSVTWVVPIPPFLAFLAIVLFLNKNKRGSALVAIGAAVLSLLLGWGIAFASFFSSHFGEHPIDEAIYSIPTGATEFVIGYAVDPANALMLFMVPFLVLMIFIYSSGYMSFPHHLQASQYPTAYAQGKDPRYSRFMAYICLFATGMLGLVVANNLLQFFVFWEIMGLCSYLLIGFWYEKASARAAAVKAFITTRIGDALLMIGLLLLYVRSEPSSLRFSELFTGENLDQLAHSLVELPLFGEVHWISLIGVLIFCGAIGKSAQFPLHIWLPDAMEGPTPVSAMIHAATMVSAGVFLLVRMFPIYEFSGEVSSGTLQFVAFIGAFTALFAATIAVAQWDIKRVLAYSTISQLGYMVAAIGMGAYVAALFHLLTHAFFKALLFLGSGSVIHGVEHGYHHAHEHAHDDHEESHGEHIVRRADGVLDTEDAQDMRNMGGLLTRMPRTGWTFIIGGLALSGFPLVTAGFWSKDEILAFAWDGSHQWVFWTLALAAFLTAFYTMRQIGLTFLGRPRTEGASHAPESVASMTTPLILISFFAIAAGWVGIPASFPVLGGIVPNWMEHFLEPYMEYMHLHPHHPSFHIMPLAVSLLVALGGLGAGYLVYGKGLKEGQTDPVARILGPIWWMWHRKYWIDELYHGTIVLFTMWLSRFLALFDRDWIVDWIVNGIGRLALRFGELTSDFDKFVVDGFVDGVGWISDQAGHIARMLQDGRVQTYLLFGMLILAVWLFLNVLPVILTLV